MANKVLVTLDLKDLASAALKRFNQSLDKLNSKAKSTDGISFGRLTGSIATATLSVGALQGAFDLASSAATGLIDRFKEAANIQGQTLTSAGSLMALTGMNFNEATQYLDQFAASMAIVANDLPGNTADYVALGKGITDNLVPAFQDLNGQFDKAKFDEYLKGISTSAGVLASQAGVSIQNASLGISKALSGKSISELSQIQFFEANPAVLALIEQEAAKLGGELADLSDQQRADVVRRALERATPKEVLDAARESVPGLIQRFMGQLFDQQQGVFGLLRDLNPDAKVTQTAFDGLQKMLKALFGAGGLTDTIGSILPSLGLGDDPMVSLRNGFLWLRDKINQFNLFLKDVKDSGFEVPTWESVNKFVEKIPESIGSFIENISKSFASTDFNQVEKPTIGLIDALFRGLSKIDYGSIFSNIGTALANAVNSGTDILSGLDYGAILNSVGNMTMGLLKGIGKFAATLDGSVYAMAAGGLIASGIVLPFIGQMALAVAGLSFATPVGLLIVAAGLALAAFGKTLYDNWDELTKNIKPWFDDLIGFVGESFGFLQDVITLNWGNLQNRVVSIITRMGGLFEGLYNTVATTLQMWGINAPTIGEARARAALSEADARYNDAVRANGGNTVKGFVPNRVDGFTNGLIQAAIREGRNMPSGAGLVVANTSEQILNRRQQNDLGKLLSSRSGGVNVQIGQIVSQASDPVAVAKQVINQIEYEFQKASRMFVSPVGV